MIQLLSLSDVRTRNIMIENHKLVTFHVRSETMHVFGILIFVEIYTLILITEHLFLLFQQGLV